MKADTSVRAPTILPIKTKGEFVFCIAVCKIFFLIVPQWLLAPDLSCPLLETEQHIFSAVSAPCIDYLWRCFCLCTRHNEYEWRRASRSTPSIFMPVEFHHHGLLSSPRNANTSRSATLIECTRNAVNTWFKSGSYRQYSRP